MKCIEIQEVNNGFIVTEVDSYGGRNKFQAKDTFVFNDAGDLANHVKQYMTKKTDEADNIEQ